MCWWSKTFPGESPFLRILGKLRQQTAHSGCGLACMVERPRGLHQNCWHFKVCKLVVGAATINTCPATSEAQIVTKVMVACLQYSKYICICIYIYIYIYISYTSNIPQNEMGNIQASTLGRSGPHNVTMPRTRADQTGCQKPQFRS